LPEWLDVDLADLQTRVIEMPTQADVQIGIDAQQIVELYSK
jgi:ribosomal protein S4